MRNSSLKKAVSLLLVCSMVYFNAFVSFAQWQQSQDGRWWYEEAAYFRGYAVGWELIDGQWYHFDQDGWMQTGWQLIDNSWYYFDSSGAMLSNQEIDGYYLGKSGAMATLAAESDDTDEMTVDQAYDLLWEALVEAGLYQNPNIVMMLDYETDEVIAISVGENSPVKYTAIEHYEVDRKTGIATPMFWGEVLYLK